MRLTTKSSYGVRALINLAVVYDKGKPLSIKDISQREGLPVIYLEQIFYRLKKHGLIKSVRGPKGGYILAKKPSKLNVYEVVAALEGGVYPARCVLEKDKKKTCKMADTCVSKEVWDEVARCIKNAMTGFSLKTLADRVQERDSLVGHTSGIDGKAGKSRSSFLKVRCYEKSVS